MTCDELPEEDLVAWLDGETAADDASRVAAHVEGCAVCRREAALLRESGSLLARLPGLAPSAGFDARVVAASRTQVAPRGRVFVLRRRVAAVAAAVLVGAVGGAWWLASASNSTNEVLTAHDEEALAADLAVISNLDALQKAEPTELAQLADDLDVIEAAGNDEEGG
jgi:anti-sigma factor RsiW